MGVESGLRLPQRCVENRPQVNQPAEKKEPEHSGEDELNDCSDQPALEELAVTAIEQALDGRGTLARGEEYGRLLQEYELMFWNTLAG